MTCPAKHSQTYWVERAALLRPETKLFIDGRFVDAVGAERMSSINPATGEVICELVRGGQRDVDRAVVAARRAFRSGVWSKIPPRDRMEVLYKFCDLIEAHGEEFALLDTLDMGKPIGDMLTADVPQTILCFRFLAEFIDKMEGSVTTTARDVLHMIVREPLGVVGCIVPWNYPLLMAAWKIAPALATGNSVVLKPAEQSPLSALLLARLFSEAGGPDGVLNVVNGFGEDVGRALALHNDVDKISFTGSTEIGKLMFAYAGQSNMKKVSTECGGKSPQIILGDAKLEKAVEFAVSGVYANQGEVCSAGSRLLVHDSLVSEFTERVKARVAEQVIVGDPLDPSTTMGPLVTAEQQIRVNSYIKKGVDEGARLVFGDTDTDPCGPGYFVKPALFENVDPAMTIAREEIFGPVAAIIPFSNTEDAVRMANDTDFGLAAGIWTQDLNTAHRMSRDIDAGIVWVNCYEVGDMTQPWGGFKQSGQGRDKCIEGMLAHTQTKSIWIDLA